MNCDGCGASIDYRFPTTCLNCSLELATPNGGEIPTHDEIHHRLRLKVRHHLVNVATTLGATLLGLVVGAYGTFMATALIFQLIPHREVSCGTGTAIGFLVLVGGGIVGSVVSATFAFENRVYKNVSCCSHH